MTDLTKEFAAALREQLLKRNARKIIAAAVGSTPGHISNIANERRYGSEQLRRKIAEACGYSYEDFIAIGRSILEGRSFEPQKISLSERIELGGLRMVPVISWVRAGEWSPVSDPYSPGDGEEWIVAMQKVSREAFALRVVGDSMEPEFREGEIIVVDPEREPMNGSYVIAKVNGGDDIEATFKRLILDGGRTYLKPLNDQYPMMDMTGKEFRIVGVVVEKRKEY